MAIVEEVPDDDGPNRSDLNAPRSPDELAAVLQQLSRRLALPESLLPSFMKEEKPIESVLEYQEAATNAIQEIRDIAQSDDWRGLSFEQHAEIMSVVARLYGEDAWTTAEVKEMIDSISAAVDGPRIAKHLLAGPVRTLFTKPHPMLDTTTTRAAHRPFGGSDAQADFQDAESQPWKAQAGWGCYNLLAWCVSLLPGEDIEANIGLILPPTLTMMDDWEAPWRGRGVFVLNAWIEKVDLVWMKRMGMDRLLLASLLHTLQLHTNPPLPQVLPTALRLIERTMEGKKKADTLAEVVDKALLSGWIYAPSGTEGRPVLVHIAQELELMCDALGTGITRWLKPIIPHLLSPLQFTPTPAVFPHFTANLSALLKLARTVRPTGRLPRWRGQILHVLARLWAQLAERGPGGAPADKDEAELRSLVQQLVAELDTQCPETKQDIERVAAVNPQVFAGLVATKA